MLNSFNIEIHKKIELNGSLYLKIKFRGSHEIIPLMIFFWLICKRSYFYLRSRITIIFHLNFLVHETSFYCLILLKITLLVSSNLH